MLSALSANDASSTHDPINGLVDPGSAEDSRSSSLSDLEDGGEDQEDTPTRSNTMNTYDNDSEAETERLQATPRKPDILGGEFTDSPSKLGKSPSKLAQEVAMDDDLTEGSPSADKASTVADDVEVPPAVAALDILAGAVDGVTKLPDVAGKKRKRSGSPSSSVADGSESPSKKRAASVKSTLNGDVEPQEDGVALDPVEEDTKTPMDAGSDEAVDMKNGDAEVEVEVEVEAEAEAEVEAEAVAEEVTEHVVSRAKAQKARKGKRKGKKVRDTDASETPNGPGEGGPAEAEEAAEPEHDEEDPAAAAEEGELSVERLGSTIANDVIAARRESALKSISEIEKDFTVFRDK
jgi:hypothetical protein